MTVIARTDVYQVEAKRVGTLVTRFEDNATLFLQPGEDETLFLDSVFGICLPEEVSADTLDSAIDEYAEQFIAEA